METKTCTRCGVLKELGMYSPDARRKDGRYSMCRECRKLVCQEYTERNKEDEYNRKKEYRLSEKGKMAARRYRAAPEVREKRLESSRNDKDGSKVRHERYNSQHPERLSARRKINNAIHRGVLQRGMCSVCGSNDNIEAHHPDYSLPYDIVWMCRKHHTEIHLSADALLLAYWASRQGV